MCTMLDTYTVSFFGHRRIDDVFRVEQALEALISRLLREKEYVEFLVGRDGEFDQLVSSTIRRCRRTIGTDNSTLVWVMPYMTTEFKANEDTFRAYYDEIEVCEAAAISHFKSAIQIRNRSMVDRSNLVIFCVTRKTGGAFQTLRYAQRTGTTFLNLSELQSDS